MSSPPNLAERESVLVGVSDCDVCETPNSPGLYGCGLCDRCTYFVCVECMKAAIAKTEDL